MIVNPDKYQMTIKLNINCHLLFAVCILPVVICLLLIPNTTFSQPATSRMSINDALGLAKNNLQYGINDQQIIKGALQVKTSTALPKTGVFAENEDLRPGDTRGILKIGISQSIAWPGLYKSQKNLYSEQAKYHQVNTSVIDADIKRDVRTAYYQLWYLQDKQRLFYRLDSIYHSLNDAAKLKVITGDRPGLDSISATVRLKELQAFIQQINSDIQIQQQSLMQLMNTTGPILPIMTPLEKYPMPVTMPVGVHPVLALQMQSLNIANAGIGVTKNENKPEFSGRFFSQRLWGAKDPFNGFSVTAAFPVLGAGAYRNKIKAAEAEFALQQKQFEYGRQVFTTQQWQLQNEVKKNDDLLSFYETTGLKQADEIIRAASLGYRAGEISFSELSQFLTQAIDIQRNYLEVLNTYNQSVIQYNYYINQ